MLRSRLAGKETEEERLLRQADAEAEQWAVRRAAHLKRECQTAAVGKTILIVEATNWTFDEEASLRLAALERLLGVTFDRSNISGSEFDGFGGPTLRVALMMEPSELHALLEGRQLSVS